jgi:hypothetical protein
MDMTAIEEWRAAELAKAQTQKDKDVIEAKYSFMTIGVKNAKSKTDA